MTIAHLVLSGRKAERVGSNRYFPTFLAHLNVKFLSLRVLTPAGFHP
jgi:hypothetical protein